MLVKQHRREVVEGKVDLTRVWLANEALHVMPHQTVYSSLGGVGFGGMPTLPVPEGLEGAEGVGRTEMVKERECL
jgi:hypothetical protein